MPNSASIRSPGPRGLRRQKEAALKAIELDPSLAKGYAVLGSAAALGDWDWASAERHFRRALELNPNSYRLHLQLHVFPLLDGRLDEMTGP